MHVYSSPFLSTCHCPAGYSGKTCLLVTWIGLWRGQIGDIKLRLHVLLRAYKLPVIIILIVQ